MRFLKGCLLAALLGLPVAAAASEVAPREPAPAPGAGDPAGKAGSVRRFDFNRNGVIDPLEREAVRQELATKRELYDLRILAKYDANRDGRLDDAETRAMRDQRAKEDAALQAQMVARNDTNGDGTLDAAETAAMRARHREFVTRMRAAFVKRHDTNGDGILDGREQALIDQNELGALRAVTGRGAGGPTKSVASGDVAGRTGGLSGVEVTPAGGPTGWHGVDVRFSLGRPAAVAVRVFDAGGRLVRSLVANEPFEAGARALRWDGRNDGGRAVANGLYFVTVEAFGGRASRKVTVLR